MYTNKIPGSLLPLALAVTLTNISQANDDVYQLDDVIVTASRTAQTVDQTLASVSVITRKDIEQSQATSVTELLETLPGVQITSNGGPGASANLSIRGTSSSQSLVLIDGQRIGSATLGSSPIQYIDPDQIERIEVVRGPKGSLYGADAVGGVVNIITRSGSGAPTASVKIGYGSRNTRTASANLSGSNDSTRYHIGFSRFMTDGYDRTDSSVSPDRDDDSFDNTTLSLKADQKFTEKLECGISLYKSEGTSEYDASNYDYTSNPGKSFDPRNQFKEKVASGRVKYKVSEDWLSKFNLSYTLNESKNEKDPYLNSFETHRNAFDWQNDISITDSTLLTAGLDYYRDRVKSSSDYPETSRDNKAAFLQSQTMFATSDLQMAVRYDDNQRYGDETTGNIAWGYNLPLDMRVIASYGTAFRAPTFNDLYWPKTDFEEGNPNLNSESSKNAELELRGKYGFGSWSASVFQNDIDDMISWVYDAASEKLMPSNVDKARIRGLEMATSARFEQWLFKANLTLLDPEDRNTGKRLARKARQNLNIDIDRTFDAFSFGGSVRAQGDSYDDAANKKKNSGFATVDLRASWQATKELKTELKVVNLLDKEYQTVKGYDEEPRGVFATLAWSPEI